MNKKKITTSLMAVALVSSLAVGSLAWFTSQDSVTNPFSTASTDKTVDNRVDAGIKIHEDFDKDAASNVTPGQTVDKLVKVHSTAKYDQFVRANITKEFTFNGEVVDHYVEVNTTVDKTINVIKDGKKVAETTQVPAVKVVYLKGTTIPENIKKDVITPKDGKAVKALNTEFIKLNLTKNSNWLDNTATDGFYYYNEVLPAGQDTKALLDSVTLDKTAGNEYKNLGFNVVVNAESIQSANEAAKDAWQQAPTDFNTTVDNYVPTATPAAK